MRALRKFHVIFPEFFFAIAVFSLLGILRCNSASLALLSGVRSSSLESLNLTL